MRKDHKFTANDIKYLQLLAQSFPNISEASTEIINLQAILNLPKGTEHFVADIHGEYEAFLHILKNASGNIQRKVNELFGNLMRESDKRELCTLIYYPDQKLELIKASEENLDDWYHITIHNLWLYAVWFRANTPIRKCARLYRATSLILFRSCCTSVPMTQIRPTMLT